MIDESLIKLADEAGCEALAIELRRADERARAGQFTEGVMRLGRATEAALYAAAREFHVKIRLHIPQLSQLQAKLRGIEAKIIQSHRSTDQVKSLADLSKQLSQAIAELMEREDLRAGTDSNAPRNASSILNELKEVVESSDSKRRLGMIQSTLQKVMDARNGGAHACPTGASREADPAEFPQLAQDFGDVIRTVIEVLVGERSRRTSPAIAP
jgi:hypothetical protein